MNGTKLLVIIAVIIVAFLAISWGASKWTSKNYAPTMTTTTQPTEVMSPAATGNSVYKMSTTTTLGSFLTDPKGMTLYVFAKDTPGSGTSNCSGGCLATWPAYKASSSTGPFPENITVFKRADGTWQYAWKGWPLYYYSGDTKAGDTNGQGIGGVWSVAK